MQFFFIKMEGNQIELSLLSLVGLKYVTGYSADVVGAMVGLVILIYYAVVAVMTMRCSIAIWEQVEHCQRLIHTDRQIEHARKSPLGKIIDLKKMPYPSLAFYFEDLKLPTYYWQLLLPVVMFFRSLVTSIFVVLVVNQAKNQIIVVGLVEVFALAYEILARSRHGWPEQAAEISKHAFTLIYLCLKAISTSSYLSEESRQKRLGVAMMVCLICLIAVGGLFAIITIGYMIVGGVKTLIAKYKAFKELAKISIQKLKR